MEQLESKFQYNIQISDVPLSNLLKSTSNIEIARIIFDIPFSPNDFIDTYLDLWIRAKLYKKHNIKQPVIGFIVRRHPQLDDGQVIFQYLTSIIYQPNHDDQLSDILDVSFVSRRFKPNLTHEDQIQLQHDLWQQIHQIFVNVNRISKIFK